MKSLYTEKKSSAHYILHHRLNINYWKLNLQKILATSSSHLLNNWWFYWIKCKVALIQTLKVCERETQVRIDRDFRIKHTFLKEPFNLLIKASFKVSNTPTKTPTLFSHFNSHWQTQAHYSISWGEKHRQLK